MMQNRAILLEEYLKLIKRNYKRANNVYLKKIEPFKAPLKNIKKVDFKADDTFYVLQHEYGVTDADSSKPILGTGGAGPCVILVLYDKKNKKAVLTHIDSLTDLSSLSQLLVGVDKGNTVAHLAGGKVCSQEECYKIFKFLQKHGIKIENVDLIQADADEPMSMAIDARTGAIYSPVKIDQFKLAKDIERRLDKVCSLAMQKPLKDYPLIQCYDGSTHSSKESLHSVSTPTTASKSNASIQRSSSALQTVGLLSARKQNQEQTKPQQQTFCGLKRGFLL